MKAGENVQKIAVKSGVHTENDWFFRIFEPFKKNNLYTSLYSFVKGLKCWYNIDFQKSVRES